MSIVSLVTALFVAAPAPDPNAPEWVNEMARGAHGPVAAVTQTVFIILNALIIAGGVAMIRVKGWGLGLTATIIAMINFGSFCCIIGLPIGIWSLVILLQGDVKHEFLQKR